MIDLDKQLESKYPKPYQIHTSLNISQLKYSHIRPHGALKHKSCAYLHMICMHLNHSFERSNIFNQMGKGR
jgi:hypothetical protein